MVFPIKIFHAWLTAHIGRWPHTRAKNTPPFNVHRLCFEKSVEIVNIDFRTLNFNSREIVIII